MKLYSFPHSPFAARVRIQIRVKNLDVDILPPPGFKTPEYEALNIIGKVPSLDNGNIVIPESMTILNYIETAYPQNPLLPENLEQRAVVQMFANTIDTYLSPSVFALFGQLFQKTVDDEEMKGMVDALKTQLGLYEKLIVHYGREGHDKIDLADCALAPVIYFAPKLCGMFGFEDPLPEFKHINAWWQWANEQPSIAIVLQEIDEGIDAFMERIKG